MPHTDVTDAFGLLLNELSKALQEAREQASQASLQGHYQAADKGLQRAKAIEAFIAEVREQERKWKTLTGKGKSPCRARPVRLARGERTPERAYRLPILEVLDALGGEAPTREVLDRVLEAMRDQLQPVDLEPLPSDPNMPRWRNAAMWQRQEMVNEGLLRRDTPRGVWSITEQGRDYLRHQER